MKKRRLIWAAIFVGAVAGYALFYVMPGKKQPTGLVRFAISPETTIITQPLDADGYVDYVAVHNAQNRRGITPENNFAVVLWQVCGPEAIPVEHRQTFFQELGIEVPSADGDYLLIPEAFAKTDPETVAEAAKEFRAPHELISERIKGAGTIPWAAEQRPFLARWLAAQEAHLDRLVAGLERQHFYQPMIRQPGQTMSGALLPGFSSQREVARALVFRAMHRTATGDDQGAWEDINACHQLALRYAAGATILEKLNTITTDALALEAALAWLQFKKRTVDELATRRRSLEAILEPPDCNLHAGSGQRYWVIEGFRDMATEVQHKVDESFSIPFAGVFTGGQVDWDEMAREVNRRFLQLPKLDFEQGYPAFQAAWREQEAEFDQMIAAVDGTFGAARRKAREQAIVALYFQMLSPAWLASVASGVKLHQQGELIRLAYALEHYRAERGEYPETLAALVPDYLDNITPDRFTNEPLDYVRHDKWCSLASAGVAGDYSDERLYLELGEVPPDEE